jgi:hypothetical protein
MLFVIFTLILIFVILVLFRNKNNFLKENFENNNELVIGDISYENYNIDDMKINEILFEKKIEPKIMNYTYGEEGEGEKGEINTISLEVDKVSETLPEAIKKVGDKKIVNLEAIVPVLFKIAEKNTKSISDIKVDFEKLRADFIEVKKKI